ncbi:MAG: MBL fold metallo-hydrolase [Actinomycetales bacterium]|nr:MBL fold metallo-hydrolase [Actinomycetales bacterium]
MTDLRFSPRGDGHGWREVARDVLVRRNPVLDLNLTLVLGDRSCLIVDTDCHDGLARELVRVVRSRTVLPWVVVNTHAHFDHCFGNAVLAAEQPGLRIWAHRGCLTALTERGEEERRSGVAWMRTAGRPVDAAAVAAVTVTPPTDLVEAPSGADPLTERVLDLGDRHVVLRHAGRGHTDHDLVVLVPDAGVSVVGDLVEEGAPPAFEDSYPLEWPETLDRLLPDLGDTVIPGHGQVIGSSHVVRQRDDLLALADRARDLLAEVGTGTVRGDGTGTTRGDGDDTARHRSVEARIAEAARGLRLDAEAAVTALHRVLATGSG